MKLIPGAVKMTLSLFDLLEIFHTSVHHTCYFFVCVKMVILPGDFLIS